MHNRNQCCCQESIGGTFVAGLYNLSVIKIGGVGISMKILLIFFFSARIRETTLYGANNLPVCI